MHIWVDAEACPQGITDLLCRAAARRQIALTLVATQPLRAPPSPWITALRVPAGVDGADHAIVQRVRTGDLAVTADLPLRHVLDERRQRGVDTGGPAPFGARDRPAFATQGDRRLTRAGRTGPAASW
jgi:uncharacterized protein